MGPRRSQPRPPSSIGKGDLAAAVGGAGVLSATWMVAARPGRLPAWEERAFRRVNDLPDGAWPVVWMPMQLGNVLGSLGVVALTWRMSRDRRLRTAALAASQGAWWTGKVVKALVSRERPAALLSDVRVREAARGLGYLSGHAAVAFSLASAVAPSMPSCWRPVPYAAAVAVAFGRVYAGAHLAVDVIGGAGLGIVSGTSARWFAGTTCRH